jgi:hypothetical protein
MSIPFEEYIVFALLLLGVVGIYYALKLHYVFAFGLVKNTSISEKKKQKIEKIKTYIFVFLKVLLILGLMAMSIFATAVLLDGMSLKGLVIELWDKIPDGFWLHMLWILVRIAILIVLMRYVLKAVFRFLDKQQEKIIAKKRYNTKSVTKVYLRVHNTIKYTFVLGVVYRIIHFFPFLAEVSHIFLAALILFFIVALAITIKELIVMIQTRK